MKTNSTYKLDAIVGAKWTIVATLSFVATFFSLPAAAQDVEGQLYCSVYFQARADWMRGLDGNKETIDLMEGYAKKFFGHQFQRTLVCQQGSPHRHPSINPTLMPCLES